MNELEHAGETKLIDALRAVGLKAHHMDTTIDGFPDVVIFGEKVVMVEMKKPFKPSAKIKDVMQPTQPVFMHDAYIHGYKDIYLCAYRGNDSYDLYSTEGILIHSMANQSLSRLMSLLKGVGVRQLAIFLLAKTKLIGGQ